MTSTSPEDNYKSRSYFTCTLGEAELLNCSLPESPYNTVNGFIDYLAEKCPGAIAVGCAFPERSQNGASTSWLVEALSFKELPRLSQTLAVELVSADRDESSVHTVALYASSSLVYLIYLLAYLRAGFKVALISTACGSDAVRHLLKAYGASIVCCDKKHSDLIDQALRSQSGDHDKHVKKVTFKYNSIDQIKQIASSTITAPANAKRLSANQDEIVLYGHSSGTSTGLPKPIPVTYENEIGSLPRFHQIQGYERPAATLSTTPFYTGGLADLWRSWSAGTTLWTYPENEVPITAENITRYKDAVNTWIDYHSDVAKPIGYLSCVPFVTQMMAQKHDLLGWLRAMKMAGVGGAAMPASLGDMLVEQGVNLVSRFGSRECGFLLSSDRDFVEDKAWQYLRHNPAVGAIVFKKWNETEFELIVEESWPSISPSIRDRLPYNSHDVFVEHQTIHNAWRYNGRSDVQITLITGKKFDPAGIEAALSASEWIHDAVVIGNDRIMPAAIIFASEYAERLEIPQRGDKIWEAVSSVNDDCPSHAKLKRDMIYILPSSQASEIQKSSKGTVMRGKFNNSFARHIEELYSTKRHQNSGPLLNILASEQRKHEILMIVRKHLGSDTFGANDAFYDAGVDSTMSMQIRSNIRARLSQYAADLVPLNVVYEAGTVSGLSDLLEMLCERNESQTVNTTNHNDHKTRQFLDRIQQWHKMQIRTWLRKPGAIPSKQTPGAVVLLTGTTGFLGSHILVDLLGNPQVRQVICLLRPSAENETATAARLRLLSICASYGLIIKPSGFSKFKCFHASLHEPGLGLKSPDLQYILLSVTHIVHAAWSVNFSLPLQAYETQIQGLANLYDVARSISEMRTPIVFNFISSTAAVLNADLPIAERLSTNSNEAADSGYGQSKWVAEAYLGNLQHDKQGPQVNIIRVGQLTSNQVTGAWNRKEAWPLMLDAGFNLLADSDGVAILPDLSDVPHKQLDWLPVDLAAEAILDLTLNESETKVREPIVYHVLSNLPSPTTWANVNDWLSGNVALDEGTNQRVLKIRFIHHEAWLDLLETKSQKSVEHLAVSLIPLWRDGWKAKADSVDDRLMFSTQNTESSSSTMRKVTSSKQSVDKESFFRMLGWLLHEKHPIK